MKNITGVIIVSVLAVFVLTASPVSRVLAGYVLPYPSYMPGNKMYRVSRMADRLKYFWNWGSIARVKYHLALSDKYLVESKTLFEYMQYFLAVDALARSDRQFTEIPLYLMRARSENKDVSQLVSILKDASAKHAEILSRLKETLPREYTWTPEKSPATTLNLSESLDKSVRIRQQAIEEF